MKNIFLTLILIALLSSCSHRIVRKGYYTSKYDYTTCDVVLKRDFIVADTIATKLGEIKLGDKGFSTKCNEFDAIRLLKNEACAIDADLIVITKEDRPGALSTCYRCSAEFYKLNSSDKIIDLTDDDVFDPKKLAKRVDSDKNAIRNIFISSFISGFIFGFLFL